MRYTPSVRVLTWAGVVACWLVACGDRSAVTSTVVEAAGGAGGSASSTGGRTSAGGRDPGPGGSATTGGAASDGGPGGTPSSGGDGGTDAGTVDGGQDGSARDAAPDAPVVCSGRCVEPPPAGWLGPGEILRHEYYSTPPACPGPFQGWDWGAGVDAGRSACLCTCSVAASACAVEVWAGAACAPDGPRAFAASPQECVPVASSGHFTAAPVSESVTCGAPVVTPQFDIPAFHRGVRTCGDLPPSVGCEEGLTCAPEGRIVCIRHEGDVDCPSGPYTERQVIHGGLVDTRACSECTCNGSPTCAGTVELRSGGCTSSQVGALPVGAQEACTDASLTPTHAVFRATTRGGQCTATGGELTGAVTGVDPHTLCCLP